MKWKPVNGYEGLYEVSDSGDVRSCDRYIKTDILHVKSRLIKGRILRQATKNNGYNAVDLCKEGKVKTTAVHRIVAEAFLPNPNGLRFVNHKDSNRRNNSVCNLEWVTSSENRMHGISQGNVTFRSIKVLCIETGIVFEKAYKAAKWLETQYPERVNSNTGIVANNIRMACRSIKHTAYGFTWQYHEGSTTISKESTHKRVEMGSTLSDNSEGKDIV